MCELRGSNEEDVGGNLKRTGGEKKAGPERKAGWGKGGGRVKGGHYPPQACEGGRKFMGGRGGGDNDRGGFPRKKGGNLVRPLRLGGKSKRCELLQQNARGCRRAFRRGGIGGTREDRAVLGPTKRVRLKDWSRGGVWNFA